jgi:hypothetical protein
MRVVHAALIAAAILTAAAVPDASALGVTSI